MCCGPWGSGGLGGGGKERAAQVEKNDPLGNLGTSSFSPVPPSPTRLFPAWGRASNPSKSRLAAATATGEEAPRHFYYRACVCACLCARALFNSLTRLRKEENLNLTSVLRPELKKKIIVCMILFHSFRRKPANLRQYLNAPFEGHLGNTEDVTDCRCH